MGSRWAQGRSVLTPHQRLLWGFFCVVALGCSLRYKIDLSSHICCQEI